MLAEHTFVEFFQAFELGREAAFAGRVDDEDHLAVEALQWEVVALLVLGLELVEGCCRGHGRVVMSVGRLDGSSCLQCSELRL